MQKFIILAFAALIASVFAAPTLQARSNSKIVCPGNPGCPNRGPSGAVVTPSGGTKLASNFLNQGFVHVNYKTVNTNQNNARFYTTNIGLSLKNATSNYPLGNLSPPKLGANIDAYLNLPEGACGNFQLVVTEQQAYAPGVAVPTILQFQSAAPSVSIRCCSVYDIDGICKMPH